MTVASGSAAEDLPDEDLDLDEPWEDRFDVPPEAGAGPAREDDFVEPLVVECSDREFDFLLADLAAEPPTAEPVPEGLAALGVYEAGGLTEPWRRGLQPTITATAIVEVESDGDAGPLHTVFYLDDDVAVQYERPIDGVHQLTVLEAAHVSGAVLIAAQLRDAPHDAEVPIVEVADEDVAAASEGASDSRLPGPITAALRSGSFAEVRVSSAVADDDEVGPHLAGESLTWVGGGSAPYVVMTTLDEVAGTGDGDVDETVSAQPDAQVRLEPIRDVDLTRRVIALLPESIPRHEPEDPLV